MNYFKRYHREYVSSSAHHISSYLMSPCIISDFNLSHFPKMGSTKILHYKLAISSSIITTYLEGEILWDYANTVLLKISPTILASISRSCHGGLLLRCSEGNFPIFLIAYALINENSLVRKKCYFFWICSCIQLIIYITMNSWILILLFVL